MNARRPTSPRATRGASGPPAPTPLTSRKKSTATPRASSTRPANTRAAGQDSIRRGSRVEFATRNNGTVSISWRAIVFVLVLAVAFVLVTPTLRHYVRQVEIERSLNAEVAALQARTEELQREIDRWDDPEYVRAQARDRLGYVMPGEQPYIVVDPEAVVGEEAQQEYEEAMGYLEPVGPWYLEVWDSIRVAGEAPSAADAEP